MWLRGKHLSPTEAEDGVRDAQLPNRGPLEVVSALPRLDEGDPSFGVQESDRKTGKAGPGAQIHHRRGLGQLLIERQGVQDQPPYHGVGVTVGGQIHPGRPARQKFRQLPQGPGERLELGVTEAEFVETSPDQ
jgi:hypothetical protein